MFDVRDLQAQDLAALPPEAITALAARMLGHLQQQAAHIEPIEQQARRIDSQTREIQSKDAELQFKEAKLQKITFELACLKAWKFGARSSRSSRRPAADGAVAIAPRLTKGVAAPGLTCCSFFVAPGAVAVSPPNRSFQRR